MELRDRFKIIDAVAQRVELDGRRITIKHRRSFQIFEALVNAPSNQLKRRDLQTKIPGCVGMGVSKKLAKLPSALKGIVVATGGPYSLYHILLPPPPRRRGLTARPRGA